MAEEHELNVKKTAAGAEDNWNRGHGNFIDHLKRERVSERVFHEQVANLATPGDSYLFSVGDRAPQAVTPYAAAVQTLYCEIVSSAMLDALTVFWKAQGDAGWVTKPRGLLRRHCEQIARMKRQAVCLRVEVETWTLQQNVRALLQAKRSLLETSESPERRTERFNEFWPCFHEMGRVRSSSRPLSPPASNGGMEAPSWPLQTLPSIASPSRQKLRSAEGQPLDGSPLWKTRASRSRCTFGRDWAQGSLGATRSSSTPDLRSTSASSTQTRLPALSIGPFDGARDIDRASTTVATGLDKSRGFADPLGATSKSLGSQTVSGFKHNGIVTKDDVDLDMFMARKKLPTLSQRVLKGATDNANMQALLKAKAATRRIPVGETLDDARVVRQRAGPPVGAQAKPAAEKYLLACHKSGIVPTPVAFATGHSRQVDGKNLSLTDLHLAAFQSVVQDSGAETVDLQGNLNLTDGALSKFVEALAEQLEENSPQALNLKRCTHAGQATISAITRALSDPTRWPNLWMLDLSGIPMRMQSHLPLCTAVGSHPNLHTFRLADTGFGQMACSVEQCMDELMSSKSLRVLDLSWSCFNADMFVHLGELVSNSSTLEALHIANCATAVVEVRGITPVAYFIEHLSRDSSINFLDVSLNRIDFRCALVLEVALEHCRQLATLEVAHNPLGVLGTRSLLRLLCRNESGLLYFKAHGCGTGDGSGQNTDFQVFSATKPEGRYKLDLAKPYHRALLRTLYMTCDRFKMSPPEAFAQVIATPAYEHPALDPNGRRCVPTSGHLEVNFTVEKAYQQALDSVGETEFDLFLDKRIAAARLVPGWKKVRPLMAQWRSIEGLYQEQVVLLEALAKDFLLSFAHIEQLCRMRSMVPDILGRLLPCVVGGTPSRYLCRQISPSLQDYIRMLHQGHAFFVLNVENPTGRYRLDLSNAADYAVAERLAILDQWEIVAKVQLGRADTSQKGNNSQVRNVRFGLRELAAEVMSEWIMPEKGILELDYASAKRPPPEARTLDDVPWNTLLAAMSKSGSTSSDTPERVGQLVIESRLQALRQVSHLMYVTSMQVRQLLGSFSSEVVRAECFVTLFNRIADMHNEKLFRVRFESQDELARLRDRLGHASYFPYVQPEQTRFSFDFSQYDQQMAANALVQIAAREKMGNLRHYSYVHLDGTVDPLVAGVPRAWENRAKMPKEGTFHVGYECAPEDRKFQLRKELLETCGCWTLSVQEDEVMWWSALKEVPLAVREYLEFLIPRYKSLDEVFRIIDGPGGNGVISFREFEEGIKKMKCRLFKGPNEAQKIADVFRYLDPSGEGQVSKGEWTVLERIWKEVDLSIFEFVQFCDRTWRPRDDTMSEAWSALDEDGSGSITKKEWSSVLQEAGFFGPAMPIFHFIDTDNEGTITADEFEALATYRKRPKLGTAGTAAGF